MKLSRLILTVVLIGVLVWLAIIFSVGADSIFKAIESANLMYLGIAGIFQAMAMVTLYLRWAVVVSDSGIKIPSWRLFLITVSGAAVTNLTPGARFGGEPLRAYFLRKYSKANTARSLATIITERIFDAATFCIISFIALVLALTLWELPLWIVVLLFVAFIICLITLALVIYISVNHRAGLRLISWFLKRFSWIIKRLGRMEFVKEKLHADVATYTTGVKSTLQSKYLWAYGVTTSLLVWLFDILRVYFIFLALGANAGVLTIAVALVISALAGAIPLIPGGLGLTESAMILIYTSSNIALVAAGTVTIVDRIVSYWAVTFIGLLISSYLGIEKYEVKKWQRSRVGR